MSTVPLPRLSNQYHITDKVLRMPVADDRQLIIEAKEGNQEAFRQLVERHMKQAYNIAYGFLHHHDLAQDVTQDAFVRVYHGLPSFRGDAGFSTWLYRIVTNVALNRLKMEKSRTQRFVFQENGEIGAPHDGAMPVENNERRAHIEKALHELPTMQRSVVILRHLDGLSTRQVSSILGCSEGTIKTHLFRGLKKLKRRLEYFRTEIA